MAILFSVVSRGEVVLCNAQNGAGNFTEVARSMLPNIALTNKAKTTYTSDIYLFHVLVDNGLIFMCASDPDDGKAKAYAFLTQAQSEFGRAGLISRAHFAVEGELNGDFSSTLQQLMDKFSKRGHQNGQLDSLQSQVDEVKGVMTQNIEKVLQRGENLDTLMEKTTDLEHHSMAFKKTARQVHRKMWWKNMKMMCILGIVVSTVVLVLILIILFSTGVLPPDSGSGGASSDTPAVIIPTTPATPATN